MSLRQFGALLPGGLGRAAAPLTPTMPAAPTPEVKLTVQPPCLGVAGSDAEDGLAYRAIPAWGVRQATGAVVEAGLLLVADRLVCSCGPAEHPGLPDPPVLWQALLAAGRVLASSPEAPSASADGPAAPGALSPPEVVRWLAALRAGGEAWRRQEAVAEALHQAGPGRGIPWREALHEAGLAEARHSYRNRLQTLDVLATLGSWGVEHDLDGEIARELLGSVSAHVRQNLRAAASAGAIPHDWEDMGPLYACSGFDAVPWLQVRLPVLIGTDPPAAADLLASEAPDAARQALSRALCGTGAPEAVWRAADLAVPPGLRVRGLSRTLAFHRQVPVPHSRPSGPGGAALAISSWRLEPDDASVG